MMMEDREYAVMYRVEDTHWWYKGMQSITCAVLDRAVGPRKGRLHILDAGCGTGGVIEYLRDYGQVTACDYSEQALHFCRTRRHEQLARASVMALPYADAVFDLVTSFDVLCTHGVCDDEAALREFARVLKRDGLLLLRLPAYNWLRGRHDVQVAIRHRYRARELKDKLQRNGLEVMHVSHANMFLFPIALAKRLAERIAPPQEGSDLTIDAGALNGVMRAVLRFEAPLVARARLPFGLTLVALGRKR
jgi:SAM-dependent methyltransferase